MSTYTDASLIVTPNAYKAGKLYSLKPTDGSGDLGVVRATTATYVGSDGLIKTALANEPRIDYTNGSCPSILIEPQRTNLLLRSEQFDNASWGKANVTVAANQTTAPDGNLSADLLSGISTGVSYLFQNATVVSGQTYTISIFAKKNQTNFLQIFGSSGFGLNNWANFDLENGIIGTTGVGAIASITPYDDGWYRCSIQTSNPSGTTGGCFFVPVNSATASRNPSFNATNHSIYIWGAQLEAGANATSYIPTTTTAVTRNADVISKSGISNLIGQTEGTMFIDFLQITNGINTRGVFTLGETNNYIEMSVDFSGRIVTRIIEGGINRGVYNPLGELLGFNKFALAYTSNGYKLFKNGVKVYETSSTILPLVINNLYIGVNFFNNNVLNGEVKQAQIYKTALTDAECIALTTL